MASQTIELPDQSAAATFDGFEIADMRLTEGCPREVWSIAPYPGHEAALETLLPSGMSAPNRCLGTDDARLIWSGRAQALWIADVPPAPGLAQQAALVDQSDGWCVLWLEGAGAADVLARLCPLDLAPAIFGPGHTARSMLWHMTAQITWRPDGYEIMVFRSMAETAVHEIAQAMRQVAARQGLSISG